MDELLTQNAAAKRFGRDRRTIEAALLDVAPDSVVGRSKRWRVATIEAALAQRAQDTAFYRRNGTGGVSTADTLAAKRAEELDERILLLRLDRLEREGEVVSKPRALEEMGTAFRRSGRYLWGLQKAAVPELLAACHVPPDQQHQAGAAVTKVLAKHLRYALTMLGTKGMVIPDEYAPPAEPEAA
jgi:hypothetical protein